MENAADCHVNHIDIYGNLLSEASRKERFCGTFNGQHKSDSNQVRIRLHAASTALNFAFTILFTAFRETKTPGNDVILRLT